MTLSLAVSCATQQEGPHPSLASTIVRVVSDGVGIYLSAQHKRSVSEKGCRTSRGETRRYEIGEERILLTQPADSSSTSAPKCDTSETKRNIRHEMWLANVQTRSSRDVSRVVLTARNY